jgi:ketosteroid isomerase-like protein
MRHSVQHALLIVLITPALALAQTGATVKVGKEIKNAFGTIVDMQDGDVACLLEMKDDKGAEFFESADFDICQKRKALKGKRVALTYKMSKVLAESCQGDVDCKKSDIVALVISAKVVDGGKPAGKAADQPSKQAAGQTSFCTPMETVAFSCRTGAKMVSVCTSKDASKTRGYMQYRFGKPDSRDPLELMLPEGYEPAAKVATGTNVPFAGGGGAWLRIAKGNHAYVLYTGIGKWGPKGETREKAGLVVERDGKRIASLKCAGEPDSIIGPDWFEQLGIRDAGQDFLFPD